MCECHYRLGGHQGPPNPWMYPHPPSHHYCIPCSQPPLPDIVNSNSNRDLRNKAEKSRRDRLNQFITELGSLVPMVANSAKRLDKTSILRLSATFLRMHQILTNVRELRRDMPNLPNAMNWCQKILEGMEGMLLVVTSTGKIVFISHTVENLLGHQQIELLGQSLFNITSLEDHDELKKNLKPDEDQAPEDSSRISRTSRGPQRRSFYLRLRQRAVSRSDQPQYELVHIIGHLRVPPPPSARAHRTEVQVNNDVVLVALVKPFREKRITNFSLLEASKEEWITRHLLDGRIIFTDHRISVLSGYMSEEVTGMYAFRYMHKDDVRWVMIALRQMYYRGESYGSSCYRLMSKTGEYIYIQTHGYLELEEDSNSIQSFICINTLVSREEGERHILRMKELYTPAVSQKQDPGISGLAEHHIPVEEVIDTDEMEEKENEEKNMKEAVHNLLLNLPPNGITAVQNSSPPDMAYNQLAMYSKVLPPASIQSSRAGVEMPVLGTREGSSCSNSSTSTSTRGISRRRESVLRLAPNPTSALPVEDGSSSGFPVGEKQKRSSSSSVGGSVGSGVVVKRPRSHEGQTRVIVGEGVIRTTSRSETRHHQDYRAELSVDVVDSGMDTTESYHPLTPPLLPPPLEHPPTSPSTIYTQNNEFFELLSDDQLRSYDINNCFAEPEVLLIKTDEELEEGMVRSHRYLEERITYQGVQLEDIDRNLAAAMPAVGVQTYRDEMTNIQAEHRKQQEILRNLKQDRDSMQHCKEHLTMRGAHQDIGA